MSEVLPILRKVFNVKIIVGIFVVIAIIWGGFWIYSSQFFGLFSGAESGGDAYESSDEQFFRENGLETSVLFGMNTGSVGDKVPVSVKIADYFGTLSEPRIQGETGISAATFYGELYDEREIVDQFVEYVHSLVELQNLYSIDVYAMLDQTTERDEALDVYITQVQDAYDRGSQILQSIRLNIDDLTVSYNSISDDKTSFEQDFFSSLEALEPERSDALLKSFVDVSQKQVALKARVAALQKVASYFENALKKLAERKDAVENNKQALVQGIRVVEVPGASELDIIIRP